MSLSVPDDARSPDATRLSLRFVLIVPFLLLLFVAVGLTGWISLRNGQKAVDEAIAQLRSELTRHVHEYLGTYLETAHRINQLNAYAIHVGQLDDKDPAALGRFFWHELEEFDDAAYIFFGSPHGGAAGAGRADDGSRTVDTTDVDPELGLVAGSRSEYSADPSGRPLDLLSSKEGMDARRRPWFQDAIAAEGPVWTDVYPLFVAKSLAIAASKPIYHEDGSLRGVLAVDLTLADVGEFLRQLQVGKTGEVFIVERTGQLVATSTEQEPFSILGEDMERHWALDRREPLIAETTRHLVERFEALHRIEESRQLPLEIAGERYFVQVSPLADGRGIDWLIVTVIPEADFMDRIHDNTRNTIWLTVAALVVATILGLLTSRWIARPIVRLNEASKALARGQWDHEVDVRGLKEADELAASFNRMATELRASFEELETRVEQRTADLREAMQAANAANQAKSRFLANVSHELRTPLAAILGYVELMRDQGLPAETEGWVRTIRSNGKHLDQLVSDLLDVTRIEAGRLDLHLKPCELSDLLAQLSSVFEPEAKDRGLELEIETGEWLPWRFDADPVRLRQVLSNLISNAVKYTETGWVKLTVHSDRQPQATAATHALAAEGGLDRATLSFVVEDTGVGIAVADQERLFQRFTRLERSEGGFGLGLAITRQLVDLMGGQIQVESRLSEGSRFTVRLPLEACRDWAQEERGYEKSGHVLLAALPSLRGRALIADDSVSLRDLCRQMLERWGIECETADNGEEAVAWARRRSFDVILMDWQMPVMDGIEATVRIRRLGVATPIIALTASAMAGDRERCLEAGCNDYLAKPIDFKELHRLLGEILEQDPESGTFVVDDEMAELALRYLRSLPGKVQELRDKLGHADWKPFNDAVHKLVGTVGTYRLKAIYQVAEELEQVALKQDAPSTGALLDELSAAVHRTVAEQGGSDNI